MTKTTIVNYIKNKSKFNEHKPSNKPINDKSNRPTKISDYICDSKVIDNLMTFIKASKERKDPLDHTLLDGPPGLGKTTLAYIIANEMETNIKVTSGTILNKPGDLAGILTSLNDNDVLFIDEIHRLNSVVEEYLYTAMEDFKIDILLNSGTSARSVTIKLHKFTLIGATTQPGLLTAPLLSRFGIKIHLHYYNVDDLALIAKRSANILNCKITDDAAKELARRSRGTPRILNNLLKRLRDFSQIEGSNTIDLNTTKKGLQTLNIDSGGLDENDIKILECIVKKFAGGPVGISTISMTCNIDAKTIEEMYEPYLIYEGYIQRTPRGRTASTKAYQILGLINNSV